jgi:hypothetical protein
MAPIIALEKMSFRERGKHEYRRGDEKKDTAKTQAEPQRIRLNLKAKHRETETTGPLYFFIR